MKKIFWLFFFMLLNLGFVFWAGCSQTSSSEDMLAEESVPDFLNHLNLKNKWTDNSENPNIMEFKANSLSESEDKCQAEMPQIDKTVIGGGVEPSCLQYEMSKYSCICVLKLHKKNEKPFKEYVFYLKQ